MKNNLFSFGILFVAAVFLNKHTIAQDRSYYTLNIVSSVPKSLNFINNSNLEVKVCIYNNSDGLMTLPLATFNVKAGGTGTYKTGIYNVKIFKPQFIDKWLNTKTNVSGDLKMSGTEANFNSVRINARKSTVFRNATGGPIKICLFKRGDNIKTIPLACYDLKDNTSTATYDGELESFFVSVIQPALIDRLLLMQLCPEQSVVTVQKKN